VDRIRQQDPDPFEAVASSSEPGMNLISVDFDLVMVNRANERLYAKPIVSLLGKKCYREFEKREEPCPHCPGRLALATGEPHEAETVGVRDDGTRFAARIRAHPIMGPDNRPTGFIEVVEDITEQKRAENLARIDSGLQDALATVQNIPHALREALKAALLMESIDLAAVYQVDPESGEHRLVQQQGVPAELSGWLAEVSQGVSSHPESGGLQGLRAVARVPIMHRGTLVATLVAATTTYPDIPLSVRAGLHTLGTTTGNAISRILAEKCRGDAVADLEALILASPVPTWVVDSRGHVTLWNKAAERVFGWRAAEVRHRPPPWSDRGESGMPAPRGFGAGPEAEAVTWLPRKAGGRVPVRLSTVPFRDVVGNESSLVVMAEDLSLEHRLAQLEEALARLEDSARGGGTSGADTAAVVDASSAAHASSTAAQLDALGASASAGASAEPPLPSAFHRRSAIRVLIIDAGEPWGEELVSVLTQLGGTGVRCASVEEARTLLAEARNGEPGTEAPPFSLAVVSVVGPGGSSGLGVAAALRSLGWRIPVVMCSETEVRGYEEHGIAGIFKRPFRPQEVSLTLHSVLGEEATTT
jgi:PAS domain S-box-containing protein